MSALSATQTDIKETKVTKTLLTLDRAEEVPEPSQETARKSVTELFRFADTRHTLNIWQRGTVWKSQFDLISKYLSCSLLLTMNDTMFALFFKPHKKWFIHFQSWEITSLYFLWRSWWSVLWFPSWQKYYLSNLSGKYPDNIPPSLHLHCTHPPQHLHPQTKPIVPKLLPTIWEQICQKCHYNFRVITLASAPCSCSPCCYILSQCPSLKSLLELISMNQIRKSEVWRIRGNKWWTWKDPYLMFEYKSNFNWCSIKNLWQNVDVDVDYLNIFILRDWLNYSIICD